MRAPTVRTGRRQGRPGYHPSPRDRVLTPAGRLCATWSCRPAPEPGAHGKAAGRPREGSRVPEPIRAPTRAGAPNAKHPPEPCTGPGPRTGHKRRHPTGSRGQRVAVTRRSAATATPRFQGCAGRQRHPARAPGPRCGSRRRRCSVPEIAGAILVVAVGEGAMPSFGTPRADQSLCRMSRWLVTRRRHQRPLPGAGAPPAASPVGVHRRQDMAGERAVGFARTGAHDPRRRR